MASNRFGPLAELEPSLWALSHAVTTIVEKIQQPYQQSVKVNARSFLWQSDSPGGQRTELVRSKLEALRRLSLCFRCGDCGHRASDCHNAVLCYACDQLGHRSSRCRTVTAVKPSAVNLTVKTDDLTTTTQPLIPSAIGLESGKKSIPVYCEVSAISSIKRLETELAALKQELALVKAMVSISEARYSTSNSNKKEPNRGDTIPVTPVTARYSTSNPVPVTPVTKTIQEVVVTNSDKLITVPVTLVDQKSWVSQITRTKKKTKSGSIELNKVPISREEKNVQFKRVATKGTDRAEKKGSTPKKVQESTSDRRT
ncbi:hypothetical protein FCM35_KLT03153 [Carex littledalei]|uniref:CCHC-type domain-containing protein n=1 Tax=Carex littledalei TaxID=544730 RepID=A0A833R4E8_9POAL|nr:hypothetical protein FCM35_KLT03153 [Carex littledalei]